MGRIVVVGLIDKLAFEQNLKEGKLEGIHFVSKFRGILEELVKYK